MGKIPKEKVREYNQARKKRNREAGMCVECGKGPPEEGKQKCAVCNEKMRQLYRKRKAAGLCSSCRRNPATDYGRCEECKTAERDQYVARKEASLCTKCGGENHTVNGVCEVCAHRRNKQHKERRQKVLDHYGGKCACCGEDTPEFLQLDHVNNDGAEHRKTVGKNIYRWLIRNNFPDGFQLLCANCNLAKGFYGYCPHQRKDANDDLRVEH